jgi:hypothetical protein
MANDIDMWNDLEQMDKRTKEYKLLFKCYHYRFIEHNEALADSLKQEFIAKYGHWGYY